MAASTAFPIYTTSVDSTNHEALAFTPWLARPENLSIFAETLGLELESKGTEVDVARSGPGFFARSQGSSCRKPA